MRKSILFFASLLLISSCYKEKNYNFKNADPDKVILRFEAGKDTLSANGEDLTEIKVQLPDDLKENYTVVSFKTSTGIFRETGTNEAEAAVKTIVDQNIKKRLAVVTLVSGVSSGSGSVEASIGGVSKKISLNFFFNPADSVTVSPGTLYMEGGYKSELTIKTILSALVGKPTAGQQVELKIVDPSNLERGTFRVKQGKSNENGESMFTYSLIPDTAYVGTLTIIATSNINGKIISDSSQIQVIK